MSCLAYKAPSLPRERRKSSRLYIILLPRGAFTFRLIGFCILCYGPAFMNYFRNFGTIAFRMTGLFCCNNPVPILFAKFNSSCNWIFIPVFCNHFHHDYVSLFRTYQSLTTCPVLRYHFIFWFYVCLQWLGCFLRFPESDIDFNYDSSICKTKVIMDICAA